MYYTIRAAWSVESQSREAREGQTDYIAVTLLIHDRIRAIKHCIMSDLRYSQAVIRST
jgi:hypothetical protein